MKVFPMSNDNVAPFPMSNENFQRSALALVEKYVANMTPNQELVEKALWDTVLQNFLYRGGVTSEEAIAAANNVIKGRREFFKP